MDKAYLKITSKLELKKENEIIYVLSKELQTKEVRKLTGLRNGAWYEEESLARIYGYELLMRDGNKCYIDAELDGEYIALSKLFIYEKGKGLGSAILDILKRHSDDIDGKLIVCQVINPAFFNKFTWLRFDGHQTYDYNC